MRLAVAGAGYVGLATAVGFARHGCDVQVIETDPERAARLEAGRLPFLEPSLEAAFAELHGTRLRIERTYPSRLDVRFGFVCVDTSALPDGSLDESRVEAAADSLAASMPATAAIVIRSTVNPGGTLRIERRLRRGGAPRTVLVNPEFLREGHALEDFEAPARRVIGGGDGGQVEALAALYAFSPAPVLLMDAASAELAKLASNAALALRVSMANEIAALGEAAGADLDRVLAAVGADPRIGTGYLSPGIGFGGSCLPKDLGALRSAARSWGVDSPVLDAAALTNEGALQRTLSRVIALLGERPDPRIAVIGVAFKPGSDSVRDSPALRLVEALLARGVRVAIHDPLAEQSARAVLGDRVNYLSTPEAAVDASDLVLVVHDSTSGRLARRGGPIVDVLGRSLGPHVRWPGWK
jgi:UDPglucose 6-dehydrogenase